MFSFFPENLRFSKKKKKEKRKGREGKGNVTPTTLWHLHYVCLFSNATIYHINFSSLHGLTYKKSFCSRPKPVEEILKIDIKPGWKKGTKITFPEKGNQEPGITPADLIFVVDEKPHAIFKRDGNDLVVNHKVSLLDALTGVTYNLTTLDGRSLAISMTDIVKPGHQIVIPNEGMPISKEPNKKGNLIIKFDVMFPTKLTAEQKSDLRRALGGADN
jgi:hypothetical protein